MRNAIQGNTICHQGSDSNFCQFYGTGSPFNLSEPLWSALGRGGEERGSGGKMRAGLSGSLPINGSTFWWQVWLRSHSFLDLIHSLFNKGNKKHGVPRWKDGKLQNNTNPTMPILLWKITNVGKLLLVHFDRLAVHNVIYTIDSWQVLTDNHNCDDNHTSLLLWYFSASSFAWRRLLVVSSRIICIFSNSNCLTVISFCRSDCLLSAESCNCRNL